MYVDISRDILQAVETPKTVSEIVATVRKRSKVILESIVDMEESGLLERKIEKSVSKGRPRSVISATELGREYLRIVSRLDVLPLRVKGTGFNHASFEAEYVLRLVENGRDPFLLFLELNDYVRAARGTE